MIALIALIAVGFGMATLGVALMCLGEVPFLAGKRIPALRARLIGLTLLSFLPLVAGMRSLVNLVLPDTIDPQALTWSIFGFLWVAVCVILFRVLVPKREAGKPGITATASTSKNPFGAPEPEKAASNGEAKKPRAQKKAPEPAPESLAWMEPESEPVAKKAPEPAKKSAGKKRPKPAEEDNPFDFS